MTIKNLIVQLLLCLGCVGRLLEADEGEAVAVGGAVVVLDVFNLTIPLECLKDLILVHGWWQVLDIEVAPLFGSFVPNGFSDLLDLALGLL